MRRPKNDMQILLIPGAIVAVSVFLFLLISANSGQPSSSAGTDATSSQATTSPVNPAPPVVPQSDAAPLPVTAPAAPVQATQPTAPAPEALKLLLPSEIASAKPKDNGYVVTTTFGAVWFFSPQDVETLPMSMRLRIDYGKYGAGSHGAERGR